MAERFNLTAQLQLQAPSNTAQVVGQIRKQLQGASVDVKIKANPRQIAVVNKELQNVNKAAASSAKSVGLLNQNLAAAARRFSVITVATGAFLGLARAIKNSTGEAIAFERELLKISQVTGKSTQQLGGLVEEVTRLSRSLGTSSSELLSVSRTLAQAGFSAQKTKQALESLAQTTLAATFNNIEDTTEAAIAVLRQFSNEARRSGGEIQFLQSTLDAINSVSKNFAVEAGDLTTVIRRVGGVFSAAGGNVNELIALFTSVRSTTRESAETIATGLRTIFTRLQRTDTVDQLKALGIELRNSQGQFVGAYEAVRRLSLGLGALDPRDFRFSEIVEELGGFRQIGKVIPLIQQFAVSQQALNVAQTASGSVAKDAEIAQQGLGNQIAKVRQDFEALMRQFADSSTFRAVANGALELAKAFIKIASSLEGMLPLIATLISMKIGQALAPGLGALFGGGARRKNQGGKIHAFARGGYVPGTGNRDTVPAMLQPGEFVIKKSSVDKMGVSQLHAMNQNRYNKAGKFKDLGEGKSFELGLAKDLGVAKQATLKKLGDKDGDSLFEIAGAFLQPTGVVDNLRGMITPKQISAVLSSSLGTKIGAGGAGLSRLAKMGASELTKGLPIDIVSGSTGTRAARSFGVDTRQKLSSVAEEFNKSHGLPFAKSRFKAGYRKANFQQIEGNVFEAALAAASGTPYNEGRDSANALIDFPGGLGPQAASFFGIPASTPTDAKRTFNKENVSSLLKKAASSYLQTYATQIARINVDTQEIKGYGSKQQKALANPKKKAAGGGISGPDTVPALLTPGEYVINKSAAQSIGYANLSKMNQTGVKRFAAGGAVGGVQRFAEGGAAGDRISSLSADNFGVTGKKDVALVNAAMKKNATVFDKLTQELADGASTQEDVTNAVKAYARAINKGEDVADAYSKAMEAAEVSTEFGAESVREEKKDRGAGGASEEMIAASATPRSNALADADMLQAAEGEIATFGGSAKESARTLKKYEQGISKGMTHQDALNVAIKDSATRQGEAAKSALKLAKAQAKTAAAQKKAAAAAKKAAQQAVSPRAVGRKITGVTRKIGGKAQGMKGAADSAQQIAFMAAAAASTAIQMSSLSEATKQAATETIAFGAGITSGVATVIQMLSGLAIAGSTAAGADMMEAAASTAAAGPMALVAAGVLALLLALKYFSSKAKAEADVLAKSRKANLDKVASGEGGSISEAKESVEAELDFRDTAAQLNVFSTNVLGAAAAGAALGSVAGPIGAVVGGLLGFGAALYGQFAAVEAEKEARKALVDGIYESLDTFGRLSESNNKFDQSMKDLAELDLGSSEADQRKTVKRQLDIREKVDTSGLDAEFGKLGQLAAKAGVSMSELSETTLIEKFGEGSAEVIAFNAATRNSAVGLNLLAKSTNLALAALQKAADLELTGELSTEQLQAQLDSGTGLVGEAFQAFKQDVGKEADAEVARLQAEKKTQDNLAKQAKEMRKQRVSSSGVSGSGYGAVAVSAPGGRGAQTEEGKKKQAAAEEKSAAIAGKIAAKEETRDKRIKEHNDLLIQQNTAVRLANEAQARAAAAATALALSLQETSNFMKDLNEIEFNQGQAAKDIANQQALVTGGGLDMSRDIAGLDSDPAMIKDIKKFQQDMSVAISDLPQSMQAEAQKNVDKVSQANRVFGDGRTDVLTQFGSGNLQKDPTTGKVEPFDAEKIAATAGVTRANTAPEIYDEVIAQITDAAADGIDPGEFDDIFSPIKASADAAQAANQKVNAIRNNEINNYKAYLGAVQAKRDEELKLQQGVLTATDKARDLSAEARGDKVSSADKERDRLKSAQLNLSGTDVKAGDVEGASSALQDAKKRRAAIAVEIKSSKLSVDAVNKRLAEDKKLEDVIKKTTGELDRLADQSGRASDIMGEIEKERGKRDVAKGMLQDFVFGGKEDRGAMNMGLAGVQAAAATGTVQNQSEEQRKATLGMLDRLGDIEIGGRSAKDIKEQIIFDDAVKMGLDPKIAAQISKATSKEEKLIKSLDDLGNVMIAAAKGKLGAEGQAGMVQNEVASMTNQQVLEAKHQEKLSSFAQKEQEIKDSNDPDKAKQLKQLKRDRSSYMQEAKGKRADFMQGKITDKQMKEERRGLVTSMQGKVNPPPVVKTEEEIAAEARRAQVADEYGSAAITPLQQTPEERRRQAPKRDTGYDKHRGLPSQGLAGGADPIKMKAIREYGADPDAMQQISTIAQHPERYNPTEEEKATQAGDVKRFMSGQQGVKNRQQMSVQGGAGFTGAGESGGMSIDPTALQGVLTEFNTNFATTLEAVVTPFSSMSESLRGLNESFSNLTMTHKFQGDLSMAFNITNQEELTTAIAKAITPKVGELIAGKMNDQMLDQSTRTA